MMGDLQHGDMDYEQALNRRDCFSELIQIDGSLYWWFEDRGHKSALLVFILGYRTKALKETEDTGDGRQFRAG